jgi:hypothetical protein
MVLEEGQAKWATARSIPGVGPTPPAAAAPGRYFYARNRQKVGPVTLAQLNQLLRCGQLQPTDMVLEEGQTKWATARSIPGVTVTPTPAPRPPARSWAAGLGRTRRPALAGVAGLLVLVLGVGFAFVMARRDVPGVPTSQCGTAAAPTGTSAKPEPQEAGPQNPEPEGGGQSGHEPDEDWMQKPELEREWRLRIEQEVEWQLKREKKWEWQPTPETEMDWQKRQKEWQKRQYVERMLTYLVRTGEITLEEATSRIREMEAAGALIRK